MMRACPQSLPSLLSAIALNAAMLCGCGGPAAGNGQDAAMADAARPDSSAVATDAGGNPSDGGSSDLTIADAESIDQPAVVPIVDRTPDIQFRCPSASSDLVHPDWSTAYAVAADALGFYLARSELPAPERPNFYSLVFSTLDLSGLVGTSTVLIADSRPFLS